MAGVTLSQRSASRSSGRRPGDAECVRFDDWVLGPFGSLQQYYVIARRQRACWDLRGHVLHGARRHGAEAFPAPGLFGMIDRIYNYGIGLVPFRGFEFQLEANGAGIGRDREGFRGLAGVAGLAAALLTRLQQEGCYRSPRGQGGNARELLEMGTEIEVLPYQNDDGHGSPN